MFMREDRKYFGFNISSVANQRMSTSAAFKLRKVESLLLRQTNRLSIFRFSPWAACTELTQLSILTSRAPYGITFAQM